MQEEEKKGITRKIRENFRYRVWRRDINNGAYYLYSIQLRQKLLNGDEFIYYQPVKFKSDVILDNGTDIMITRAIENDRPNPKDPYGFIREYMILEFDYVNGKDSSAVENYRETNYEIGNEEETSHIEVTPDDLPF